MASADKNIEAAEESSRSVAGYVGVDPIYKNSATIHNRPLREDDEDEKGETQKGLEAFALDTEDNDWNGTLGAVDPDAYEAVGEANRKREEQAAKDAEEGGEGLDDRTKELRQTSAADGAKQSSDKADDARAETAKTTSSSRPTIRK